MKFLYAFLAIICLIDGIIIAMIFMQPENIVSQTSSKYLLSSKSIPSPLTTFTPTPSSSPSATPLPGITLKKSSYTIAAYGDSMIDTMGENLDFLQAALKTTYPKTTFHLYNYGIGGQNVTSGLSRFDASFSNRERNYPPISQINADVIIVGSFAYNPFAQHDPNKHYAELTALVKKAKAVSKQTYMLAEISPREVGFGKGPHGVNWPEDIAHAHTLKIIEQLENTQNIAKTLGIPLIDVTTRSRVNGKFGEINFVNPDDGIHPSVAGHIFTANIIVKTLNLQ